MVLITSNKQRRLLCMNYVQRVSPEELAGAWNELKAVLDDLPPGIQVLADLSQLEYMDPACENDMGRAMDLMDQHGVVLIVRVIPDPSKDIGLNILTLFHYPRPPRVITCESLAQALKQLALWS